MILALLATALATPLADTVASLQRSSEARVAGVLVTWHDTEIATGGGATPDTPFELGSTSKLFTGLLLATAAIDGTVGLDDRIDGALPPGTRFPDGPGPTWLELATHTSGLPKLPPNQPEADRTALRPYTTAQVFAAVPLTERGPRDYSYSNYGVGLLGETLGRRLGSTYPEALTARVLDPLGLRRTGLLDVPDGVRANGKEAGAWNFQGIQGAGSLDSTPRDQQRWLEAWLDPEATPIAPALRLAMTPHLRRDADQQVGLAWRIRETDDGVLWQHTGSTQGYSTWIGLMPSQGIGIVLLQGRLDTEAVADAGKALLDTLLADDDPAADRLVKAAGGAALVSRDGHLVHGGDALWAAPRTGDGARGLWLALAGARAVERGLLPADRVVDGLAVRDRIARCWAQGAAADDPLAIALLQATGEHAPAFVDRWVREPLGLPAMPLDALRPRDLLRIGERGLPKGMPPAAPGAPVWSGDGIALWAAPGRAAVLPARADTADAWARFLAETATRR